MHTFYYQISSFCPQKNTTHWQVGTDPPNRCVWGKRKLRPLPRACPSCHHSQRDQERRPEHQHDLPHGHQVHFAEPASKRRRLQGGLWQVAFHDHPHLGGGCPRDLDPGAGVCGQCATEGVAEGMDPDVTRHPECPIHRSGGEGLPV